DQKAHLVCQPDHCFVMRIMRQPNKICAQLFRPGEQSAVIFFRESAATAEWRFLVEANAAQKSWLSVQQDLRATSLNCAEADVVFNDVFVCGDNHAVERGF